MRQIDNLEEAMELIKSTRTVKEVTFQRIIFCELISNVDFEKCKFLSCEFSHEIASTSFKNCCFYNVKITGGIKRTNFYNSKKLDLFFSKAFVENCFFDNLADIEKRQKLHHLSFTDSHVYGTCFWNIDISTFDCDNNYFNYCDFNNYRIKQFMDNINFFYNCVFDKGTFDFVCGDGGTYTDCKISKDNGNFLNWAVPTCPVEGGFIGYKKIIVYNVLGLKSYAIAKLQIPENAKRIRSNFRKCRCDRAIVLSIVNTEGQNCEEGYSKYNSNFKYKVGEEIVADAFNDNPCEVCTHGIHFFMTQREAECYNWG